MDKRPLVIDDFSPIQPVVSPSGNEVIYKEYQPDLRLRGFVHCYWLLKSRQPIPEGYSYRVVADGCMDVYFNLDNPQENSVTGFCKTFIDFPLGSTFKYVGIRFLPGMFPQLFKVKASELTDRSEALALIVPSLAEAIKHGFKPSFSIPDLLIQLDQLCLKVLHDAWIDLDPRVYRAIKKIVEHKGMSRIEKDLETGMSARQLRRMFDYYIGTSPKTFSRVIRFQKLLSESGSKKPHAVADLGYYDQAHLIKEFKSFYGATPAQANIRSV